jgi:hypothetical protein
MVLLWDTFRAMRKALLFMAGALVALVAAILLPEIAQATVIREVDGREKAATFSIPDGTSGFTLLHEGDGNATLEDAYGPFAKDADQPADQAHYSASEESTESVTVLVKVDHRSSRDWSRLTLVLDQENESGLDLPRAGFGLRWNAGTHPTEPHAGLAGSFRLEKPVDPSSNNAFTGEFEYAGERLNSESARWVQTGSSQDDLRLWAGVANRPRLGLRYGLEGGLALNPMGSNVATTPLGLRVGLGRPIEPGNWLEYASKTQALIGLGAFSVSEELAADVAWLRWGTRSGAVALTAGGALGVRYEKLGINADLEPRLGVQWASRWGTLRLRAGLAFGDRPAVRSEVSLLPY